MKFFKTYKREFYALCSAIFVVLLLIPFVSSSTPLQPSYDLLLSNFPTEEEYVSHITEKVKFKDLTFSTIQIEKGDNFWKVARRNKVNINSLLGSNPFWKKLFARINQTVVIPSEKGVIHFVDDLEDIDAVAKKYEVAKEDILVEELPALYKYTRHFFGKKKIIALFVKKGYPISENMTAELGEKFKVREMFRSPLGGRLSSFFGIRRHPIFKKRRLHNGLDIAAKRGTLVGASRAGVVIRTGWMGGYGKAVVIQHPDGYRTLYGHLSRILTRRGRKVRAGSAIGRVGSTGWSTGPHLHFTLWKGRKLINPLKVLW